jgi:von Willebrand factor type A domain
MTSLADLWAAINGTLVELQQIDFDELEFGEGHAALIATGLALALTVSLMLLRYGMRSRSPRHFVSLPAVLPIMKRSQFSSLRHGAMVPFMLGVPFFAVGLADPYISFVQEDVSHSGHRIALMIDASTSMNQPFQTAKLEQSGSETYFATVAAAEYFMKLRMKGAQRDLVSLIEFGNEAYVVTPFTTDYESILLSLRLISDRDEWHRFPDQGTIIIQAIRQGTQLFRAFDFLNASGNLMVIFSDGQDSQTMLQGRPIEEIMAEAREHHIPVYMIRMAFNKSLGGVLPDAMWKQAIERTGGRFYPAADEKTILRAVHEINQLAPGRIDIREYTAERPRFAGFIVIAVLLWLLAAAMKLGVRGLRSFP